MAMHDKDYLNKGILASPMSDHVADKVFGRKFPDDIDSPLFLEKLMDSFFEELANADNSPSMQRQRKIENTIKDLIESFHEALIRLNQDIEASVSLVKGEIENISNNN